MVVRSCLLAVTAAAVLVAGTGLPARAATPTDKAAVLNSWTQPSAASFAKWRTARADKGAWKAYGFDWSTDGCTGGPDRPFGYDFRLACYRHDFGYRNYGRAGDFKANKVRLDRAFLGDMQRTCGHAPLCLVLAATYYRAAVRFGHA
ncbi:phospholipase [Actinoplanes sp. NPDC049265]|uniref:phospholipase n=1 Tax=Actinoplanes sp. NPDC049265 TaxID=3363902 RepID=UPI00371D585C